MAAARAAPRLHSGISVRPCTGVSHATHPSRHSHALPHMVRSMCSPLPHADSSSSIMRMDPEEGRGAALRRSAMGTPLCQRASKARSPPDQEGRHSRTTPSGAPPAQPSSPIIRKARTAGESALRALQSIPPPLPCHLVGIKEWQGVQTALMDSTLRLGRGFRVFPVPSASDFLSPIMAGAAAAAGVCDFAGGARPSPQQAARHDRLRARSHH